MPTYEYECRECGYSFESFQSINDAPLETCPLCGGAVKRLIFGGSGIIFKGPGFYITDSKKSQSAVTCSSSEKDSSFSENTSSSESTKNGTKETPKIDPSKKAS
ncbi:MAG TPA: zinc ribbon domain-containing protein [Rectinema sp.]|nr:zinc ribbon domain-containing protein [Spirochaetota bacterium]HOU60936.1 zinc ribbon domain-containing protein [Rectinema sp.]